MVNLYLNHGRWIVECPRCTWAAQGAIEDFRRQHSFECGRLPSGLVVGGCGYKDELGIPAAQTVAAIERIVGARPAVNKNWYPSESLDDLRAQNAEHEIEER